MIPQRDFLMIESHLTIVRVERNDFDFNLALRKPEVEPISDAQAIIAVSRAKYATPRAEVEAALLASLRGEVKRSEPTDSGEPSESRRDPIPKPPPSAPPSLNQHPIPPQPSESPESLEESPSHTAIKDKIGSEAENLDYSVTFEEHFPPVQARADVVLRRGDQTIICQVSATTPAEFEAESVRKFLKLNLTHIAVVSINRKKLHHIQESLTDIGGKTVGYYSPEEFITKLHNWAMEDPEGGTFEKGKPQKRKITFDAGKLTHEERQKRESEMLNSLRLMMQRK